MRQDLTLSSWLAWQALDIAQAGLEFTLLASGIIDLGHYTYLFFLKMTLFART